MKALISGTVLLFFATCLLAYSGGSGTQEDPYQIATLSDLQQLSNTSDDWDKYFVQTADIDASATTSWDGGAGFNPIASQGINFSGSYDGQGHTIDQLFINRPSKQYTGLFSYIGNYGEVKNLGLTNVNITGGQQTGALAGINAKNSVIDNCYSTGYVHGQEKVGGFAGENYYYSTITNCYTSCQVIADTYDYAGGFISLNFSHSIIKNCYSTGSVEGYEYVGGFIGGNNYDCTVSNCYSTGSVQANKYGGGFIGLNTNSSSYVRNCYSTGDVTRISGSTNTNFGGFIAWNNETVEKCYSTGSVYFESGGDPNNRGFSGGGSGAYADNFFDSEVSNQTSDVENAATPKTTAEMKNEATFTDLSTTGLSSPWDFVDDPYDDNGTNDDWNIDRSTAINNGYPFLSWQTGNDNSLPVELVSFTAIAGNGQVVLKWHTASEIDNEAFIVEKSSDGQTFNKIAELKGAGSSSIGKNYSYTDNTVTNNKRYFYRLSDRDFKGTITRHQTISVFVHDATLESAPEEIKYYTLYDNYPNPFNPTTTLDYQLPEAGNVQLTVYNSLGQKVRTLVFGNQPAGYYSVTFDATDLVSGVYYYSLQVENKFNQVKKMILIK